MHFSVLTVLELLIIETTACGSSYVCQNVDGTGLCVADILWVHPFSEHACAGWYHDRTCGGTTPGFFGETWKCLIRKEDHNLDYCGLHKRYNDREGKFDCPTPQKWQLGRRWAQSVQSWVCSGVDWTGSQSSGWIWLCSALKKSAYS